MLLNTQILYLKNFIKTNNDMTDKEKAIAYDAALERARGLHEQGMSIEILEYTFPELKESKDEKIRKQLLGWFRDCNWDSIDDGALKRDDIIAWLERQGERNIDDKVEPKFGIGDWIVIDKSLIIGRIISFDGEYYHYISPDGFRQRLHISNANSYRLWTIQDAKDGDVLIDDYAIIIFRKIGNCIWDDVIDYHINLIYASGKIAVKTGISHHGNVNMTKFKPATKEQCEMLFSKMKEAGYEWDAEKKELKEIEQKTAWSEEDETMFGYALDMIEWYSGKNEDKSRLVSGWLKSIKERMKG